MLGTLSRINKALESGAIEPSETRAIMTGAVSGLMTAMVVSFMMAFYLKRVGGSTK